MLNQKDHAEELPAIRPKSLSVAIASVLAVPAGTAMAQDQEEKLHWFA